MKWVKYITAFLTGAIFSGVFMSYIAAFIIQENLEKIVQHHIYMLERYDRGDKPYTRELLLENVRLTALDLVKTIKVEPFADCNESAKSILLNASKYSETVIICE